MNAPTEPLSAAATPATAVKPLRVYIAGPMTGIVDNNYPAFHRAAALLRACGFEVESPAEAKPPADPTWRNWMNQAIPQMLTCDAVVFLPEYDKSKGAYCETELARHLRMPLRPLERALELLPGLNECPEWLPGEPKNKFS